jgi:hypothetical protein
VTQHTSTMPSLTFALAQASFVGCSRRFPDVSSFEFFFPCQNEPWESWSSYGMSNRGELSLSGV